MRNTHARNPVGGKLGEAVQNQVLAQVTAEGDVSVSFGLTQKRMNGFSHYADCLSGVCAVAVNQVRNDGGAADSAR